MLIIVWECAQFFGSLVRDVIHERVGSEPTFGYECSCQSDAAHTQQVTDQSNHSDSKKDLGKNISGTTGTYLERLGLRRYPATSSTAKATIEL